MANIETGDYYIKNLSSGKYVGRTLAEDKSLLPKRIVTLPEQFAGQTRFQFEKLGGNNYKISIHGAGATAIDEKLFAVLLPDPPSGNWKLIRDERTGGNNFVIVDAEEGFLKGWKTADDEDYVQVEAGFIPVGKSLPPYYPPNAVWVIEPVA